MQRTIKILTILAAMIITAGQTWADEPSLLTGNGEGTSDNPYQISSYAALKEFASLVNGTDRYAESANHSAYAILTTDIVCKNDPNDEGYATDWVPIGNDTHPYTGTFDGKGHSITGLSNTGIAEVANSDYQGLFGYVGSGGVVKKVTLEYASITGKESVGGIVGYNQGTVSDCHVGSGVTIRIVQSNSSRIGGIVGSSYNGTVIDCTSAASFTMAANLGQCGEFGGIVGLASNSTVSNCLYLGDQIGGNYGVGAIVGNNYKTGDTDAIVSNCFFTSTTFTGKDNETLSNANSAVGSKNGGTVTNCGLAYTVTLGDGVAFSSTENTNTVGVKYGGKFYAPVVATVTLNYTGTEPEGKVFYAMSVKDAYTNSANVTQSNSDYMFYMPASNVTATAICKAYLTDVSYVDPTAVEPNKHTAEGTKVWVLDGTETELIAGWYICNSENLNYTGTVKLTGDGDVHLILADGKTMNIGTSESPVSGHGIEYSDYINGQSLTIYSQSGGTGALNVYVTNIHTAICARNVTINGGIVNATTGNDGIFAIDNVIINGGQVTASGGGNGIRAYTGDIVLGWTKPTDFIETSSFKCENFETEGKVVKTAEGKVLQWTVDENSVLFGDDIDTDLFTTYAPTFGLSSIKLTPYGYGGYCGVDDPSTTDLDESKKVMWDIALKDEPTSATDLTGILTISGTGALADYTNTNAPWANYSVNIILVADEAAYNTYKASLSAADQAKLRAKLLTMFGEGATHTWSTFCAQDDYQLPEGCTAYTLKSVTNGVVTVSPLTLTDNILPAYVPVMIHRSSEGATTTAIQATFAAVGDLTNGWELTDPTPQSMMYQRNDIYPSGVGYQYGGAWGECLEAVIFGNPGKTGAAIMGWITPASSNYYTFFSFYNDQLIRLEGDPGIQLHRCVVRVNNNYLASGSQQPIHGYTYICYGISIM